MLEIIKNSIDFLTTPTISFTLLTISTPILFPPNDWFDKINRKLGIYNINLWLQLMRLQVRLNLL